MNKKAMKYTQNTYLGYNDSKKTLAIQEQQISKKKNNQNLESVTNNINKATKLLIKSLSVQLIVRPTQELLNLNKVS